MLALGGKDKLFVFPVVCPLFVNSPRAQRILSAWPGFKLFPTHPLNYPIWPFQLYSAWSLYGFPSQVSLFLTSAFQSQFSIFKSGPVSLHFHSSKVAHTRTQCFPSLLQWLLQFNPTSSYQTYCRLCGPCLHSSWLDKTYSDGSTCLRWGPSIIWQTWSFSNQWVAKLLAAVTFGGADDECVVNKIQI